MIATLRQLSMDVLTEFYETGSRPWCNVLLAAHTEDEEHVTSIMFEEVDPGTRLAVLDSDMQTKQFTVRPTHIKSAIEYITRHAHVLNHYLLPGADGSRIRQANLMDNFDDLTQDDCNWIFQVAVFGRIKYA